MRIHHTFHHQTKMYFPPENDDDDDFECGLDIFHCIGLDVHVTEKNGTFVKLYSSSSIHSSRQITFNSGLIDIIYLNDDSMSLMNLHV